MYIGQQPITSPASFSASVSAADDEVSLSSFVSTMASAGGFSDDGLCLLYQQVSECDPYTLLIYYTSPHYYIFTLIEPFTYLTTRCRGSHPVAGVTEPLASSADKNA